MMSRTMHDCRDGARSPIMQDCQPGIRCYTRVSSAHKEQAGAEASVAIDRHTSTPLYLQLKDVIAQEIHAGALKPGSRVGSEAELERTHGISRITVRQAINALVQDGVLYRVPGKGTYVAARKVAPLAAFTSFSENMIAQGLTPSYQLLTAALEDPPARIRQELRLGEQDRAWRIERLLLADNAPMGLQDGYYPSRSCQRSRHAIESGLVHRQCPVRDIARR